MRAAQQTAEVVAGWLRDGRRVVAGTLVAVDGSSPLDVGASVYISEEGGLEGSVTGGCVEGAIAAGGVRDARAPGRRRRRSS